MLGLHSKFLAVSGLDSVVLIAKKKGKQRFFPGTQTNNGLKASIHQALFRCRSRRTLGNCGHMQSVRHSSKGMLETIVSLLLLLNKRVVMVTFPRVHRDRRTRHLLQVHQQLLGHKRSVCLASDLQSRDQECMITF